MFKTLASMLLLVVPIAVGLSGCGPSEEDCEKVCDWWADICFGETKSSCMDDCSDASSSDVDNALDNCVGEDMDYCVDASCCVRFVYSDPDSEC